VLRWLKALFGREPGRRQPDPEHPRDHAGGDRATAEPLDDEHS
jgi:hypothetical protein